MSDLWTGNILPTNQGLMMIDPSSWVGERGIDIAMLRLFGNMPFSFWKEYQTRYPVPAAVERIMPLYQLYYALAHVAMFGTPTQVSVINYGQEFNPDRI